MKITQVTYYSCDYCLQSFMSAEECAEHMKKCIKRLSNVFDENNNLRTADACLNCAFADIKCGEYIRCSKKYDEVSKIAKELATKPTSEVHYLVEMNQVCDLYKTKGTLLKGWV